MVYEVNNIFMFSFVPWLSFKFITMICKDSLSRDLGTFEVGFVKFSLIKLLVFFFQKYIFKLI